MIVGVSTADFLFLVSLAFKIIGSDGVVVILWRTVIQKYSNISDSCLLKNNGCYSVHNLALYRSKIKEKSKTYNFLHYFFSNFSFFKDSLSKKILTNGFNDFFLYRLAESIRSVVLNE